MNGFSRHRERKFTRRHGAALGVALLLAVPGAVAWSQDTVVLQFPNAPVSEILREYELITGKRVVRDVSILGSNLQVETGEMTLEEAARFVEQTLLLNGFALVPAGENTLKVVAFEKGKDPRSEGVPVLRHPSELPEADQVVTYLQSLKHLSPEAAAETLGAVYPVHSYGAVTPLANVSALLITENSSVIRKYLEVLEEIDMPPAATVSHAIQLERAEAEDVVEALREFLGLDEEGATIPVSGDGGGASGTALAAGPGAPPQPAAVKPVVRAVERSNSVLIVARPVEISRIEQLVRHLDAPALVRGFVAFKVNYLSVSTFLPIAADALSGGIQKIDEEAEIKGGDAALRPEQGLGTTGLGQSDRLSGGVAGFQDGSSLQDVGPQSIVVGKTLLIGDSAQNRLFASGPPEQLEILGDLLAQLDVRPPQIQISAVIAQLSLGDDIDLGLDLERVAQEGRAGNDAAGILRGRSGDVLDIDTLTNPTDLVPVGGGLSFYGQINELTSIYVTALQNKNRFKVLSRPTVYTLNNRKAVISSGQKIAVPSSTLTNIQPGSPGQAVTSSITFEEVLLQIEVLPLINADNEVTLQISQINDDIVGSQNIGGNDIPTIGTQQLLTTVMVPDGATVLLGGLISEDDRKSASGLPIFVNLPLVGPLFGATSRSNSRQELLIFIQPRIIRDAVDQFNADRDLDTRAEMREDVAEFAESPRIAESEPRRLENARRSGWFSREGEGENDSAVDRSESDRPKVQGAGRIRF